MNNAVLVVVLASGVKYGTPLLFAALGELIAERGGILNLGVEGMMLLGAVFGFAAAQHLDMPSAAALPLALAAAAAAGAAAALLHAFMVISMRASQIVSGLALVIFAGAAGLSSYLGATWNLGSEPARYTFDPVNAFGLQDLPVIGPIVFGQSLLVYLSWATAAAAWYYLARTRPGLNLRAVGESPAAADAAGISVTRYRYVHTVLGGALAGIAGACFSLSITPQWVDGLTGGAGWIAVALVIFAFWRPELCIVGAYLFGSFQSLGPVLQARGVELTPEVFSALPYVMTIVVLVAVSAGSARRRLGAPAALGRPYVREER
jgi:ABC-type uncharacterized transport system permease subunit